jgi:hypothetical protein
VESDTGGGGCVARPVDRVGPGVGGAVSGRAAGVALAEEVAQAGAGVLRLAVQVDDPETLVLPGQAEPLALRDGVQMHRAVGVPAPPAVQVPVRCESWR